MEEEMLAVGEVLKPQGIRGEIKVMVYLDDEGELKKVPRVFIDEKEYPVLSVRGSGDFAYVALKGVGDRDAAEKLRGKELLALKSECPAPPEGSYYIADLLGCEVRYESGEIVGKVCRVIPVKTTVYYIETAAGAEIAFAAADGVIADVDIERKTITVNKKRFKEVSV